MRLNSTTRLYLKRHIPKALVAFIIVITAAGYLELMGWRIIKPGISLHSAWNKTFIYDVLRTTAGATVFGMLPISLGALLKRTRSWSLAHPVLLWSIGAAVFLIVLLALILWAP